jgi:hypothetical protein
LDRRPEIRRFVDHLEAVFVAFCRGFVFYPEVCFRAFADDDLQ